MMRFLKHWRLALLGVIGLWPPVVRAQLPGQALSSKGTVFWCAFMENLDLAWNDSPDFTFQIEAAHDVTGEITLVGTGLRIPFSVVGGTVSTVDLPPAIFYPQGSEAVSNFGFLITADDSIQVKALHWRLYFSESTALLPLTELGSHYLVQGYRYQNDDQSAFIVVATEDNTTVTITPTVITLHGRPAGQPFQVQLQRGQTYQVQSLLDLAGTELQSTTGKPIALFGGARTSQVECSLANSHLYDQCLPLDRGWYWGHRIFAVPFYGQSSSVLRVLASEDDTHLQVDCDHVATLQKGETWTGIFDVPVVLYADQPVAVAQMARGFSCSGPAQNGDPMLLHLLPSEMRGRQALLRVPRRSSTGLDFSSNVLTIIANIGQTNLIRLNGLPLDNYPHTPLGQRWEFTRVFLEPDETYQLEASTGSFQAYLHGLDYANAYAHWLAFDHLELDTATENIALIAPDSVCVDSTFSLRLQGGDAQWIELRIDSVRQLLTNLQGMISQAGTAIFSAAVQAPGFCQPQLVYARSILTACPPPPDVCPLQLPNAFTPNSDQLNDLFAPMPAPCSFTDYAFSIYNRWGQMVFTSHQPYAGRDGQASGQEVPADVYAWTLVYRRYPGAELIRLAGEVTLLR